jgi:hypothetical protein
VLLVFFVFPISGGICELCDRRRTRSASSRWGGICEREIRPMPDVEPGRWGGICELDLRPPPAAGHEATEVERDL